MKVRVTAPARRDLIEIGDWIMQDSPGAAVAVVDRLEAACLSLSSFPNQWPEVAKGGLRRRPEGSYLIFYRVSDEVQVIRILHAARDWPAVFDDQ